MRRPRLFAPVRPGRLPRHPSRLCRRERPQDQSPQAHRHHGFGRLQPPLFDRGQGDGDHAALLPRGDRLVYTGTLARKPRVFVLDIASGRERLLVPGGAITFAPRFSPDGRRIVFSWANNGNTDIYVVNADGGVPQRLTSAPGADTSPSYSPDGRRIVFESDRGGTQQLYVMDAGGSGQRRISFGGGRYASPVWSPRGDLIAFTRIAGSFNIGVMSSVGRRRPHPHQRLAGRGPELGPQRSVRHVQSAGARRRHRRSTPCRSTAAPPAACPPRRTVPTPAGRRSRAKCRKSKETEMRKTLILGAAVIALALSGCGRSKRRRKFRRQPNSRRSVRAARPSLPAMSS